MRFVIIVFFVALLLASTVVSSPIAYAICQAAAATGCALTATFFAPCYAAAQSACSALLVVPTP